MAICYLNTWKRFVKEGTLDSSRLNKRIAESWYRCKQHNVNPYLRKGPYILPRETLKKRQEQNTLFMHATALHLKNLEEMIHDLGMMALLVDANGYVLSVSGKQKILDEAKAINFTEGVCWTEKMVGTNAIGTALQTGEPVMVNGTEHFTVASHQWSCAASPIFDAQKNLLGVIDLTCPLETAHPFMLGMVSSLAHTIEQEIIDQSNRNKISLIRQAIELADQYSGQPFIVVDQNDTVVAASKPIRERFPSYFGKPAEEILYPQFFIAKQSQVFSAGHEKIGTCMLLLPQPLKQPLKSPVPVQKEPFLFRGEAGTSRVFQETLERVKLVAATNTTCFISGETGTGKELIAKAIHENSCRKDGPFIAVNCGAIPKDLLESELFGYAEGAFTGAKRQGYKGKFEQADGGTLFLDEIGELSFSAQTALLRVLQERKVTPVGASREIPVDIRFITATHRDLLQLIEEGSFRQDLYYRLFVYPIHVPSLRERKEDIPALVAYICRHYNWQLDLDQTAMQILAGYSWPGNIRELLNVLENLHITIQARTTDIEDFLGTLLSHRIHAAGETPAEQPPEAPVLNMREKIQRDMMIEALKHAKGNAAAAAKLLDIPRSTFYKKLKKYGL